MDGNDDILSRVLAGETRAIARLMSKVEGRPADVAAIMAEIHKHAGKAHVIGLTGVPGSGKSTLVHAMADRDVERGMATLCLGGGNAVALGVERA